MKGCLSVSVRDNVLDEEDYPIDCLILRDGVVTKQESIHKGVYRIPSMMGWTREQIVEWSEYDDTGRHPENYHEVSVEI
jgi:hypothetical protein